MLVGRGSATAEIKKMNPQDFPAALAGLINSALTQGVNPMFVIGILDTLKGDVQHQLRENSKKVVQPVRMMPPPNGR